MKKIIIYSATAVVLGLLLTLIPAIMIRNEETTGEIMSFYTGDRESEANYGVDTLKYSVADLEILAISFIIALATYVLLKFRMPH